MKQPLQAEDLPVIVTRDGDIHVLRIRELYLIERDADLDTGMKRLLDRARDIIAEQSSIGAQADLPNLHGDSAEKRERQELKVFALKSALVALVMVIILAAAAASFSYAVREPMRKAGLKLGRSAIAQLEKGLRDAARDELTPDRRERLRVLVADAVPNLKPYITELRPLFADLCDQRQ